MKPYLICSNCGSDDISKNGTSHRGKQNYICRDCGRQFVENPQRKAIDGSTLALVERLLLERISLAGIARAAQISAAWLQRFVNRFYQQAGRAVKVLSKAQQALTVQLDKLWSFVNSKGEQQRVWLALDRDTREIIGCHIGTVHVSLLKHFGHPCQPSIANVLYSSLTIGRFIKPYCQQRVIFS